MKLTRFFKNMANIKISALPIITTLSTSAVLPMVDGGTTYQITADNLAGNSANNFGFFTNLKNATPVNGAFGPLSIGDNDLYTVPTGRRAIIGQCVLRNDTAGNITVFTEIKHSGTYYRNSSNVTVSSGGNNGAPVMVASTILDAGDILAANAITTAGAYIAFTIIEFDSTSSLKSGNVFGLSTGDNTIYTCPTGKTAIPVAINPVTAMFGRPMMGIAIGAVAPGTVSVRLVKSGGSPSIVLISGNILTTNATVAILTAGSSLLAGDSFVANVTTGDSAQSIFSGWIELND